MADLAYEQLLEFITACSKKHLESARGALIKVPMNDRRVHLVGSENNVFLKLVAKRCEELHIRVIWHYPQLEEHKVKVRDPIIYDSGDKQMRRPGGSIMGRELDLPQGPQPTAVSQALAELLHFVKRITGWSTVTIIGRGAATYMLPEQLIKDDWSVTQLHSKSPAYAYRPTEVYVNTAPHVDEPISATGLIVNIGGSYTNPWRSAMTMERVGPITVAIAVQNIAYCLEDNYYHSKLGQGGTQNAGQS